MYLELKRLQKDISECNDGFRHILETSKHLDTDILGVVVQFNWRKV